MIRAVRSIVHEDASVKEAADLFRSIQEGKKTKK
jgi:hypothetical protein